jgi:hypothetical protein
VDATGFRSVWLLTTLGRYAAEAGDPAGAAAYRLRADALAFREGAAPEGGGLLPHPVAHQLWETP